MKDNIYFNPPKPLLYKDALVKDCNITLSASLVAYSGTYTGRKPDWKRIVKDKLTEKIWWGPVNQPISPEDFKNAKKKAKENIFDSYLSSKKIYQIDLL